MVRIILLLSLFFINFSFAKGEVTVVKTHTAPAIPSTYSAPKKTDKLGSKQANVTYSWGQGDNLLIDGFIYNGIEYTYVGSTATVKIRRSDNSEATGNPCSIFAEVVDNTNHHDRKYKPTFPGDLSTAICDLEQVMSGRVINVGVLDLFNNKSENSRKNIERVDFIWSGGLNSPTAAYLSKAGHIVTEKSGNNDIQIAAILTLDSSGNPSSYGPLIRVYPNEKYSHRTNTGGVNDIRYGLTNIRLRYQFFSTDKNDPIGQKPYYIGHTEETVGMAFVDLETLGVPPNSTYYGFSYFGGDVSPSANLVDYNSFPKDTTLNLDQGDADPYGGVASYFSCTTCPSVSKGALISGYVFNDDNKNQIKDSSEVAMTTPTSVKLCKGGTFIDRYNIAANSSYYEFNVTSAGEYTIIEDASNTNDCTTSSDPTNWSSTTSNFITVNVDGVDVPNQNFGNFFDTQTPIGCTNTPYIYADTKLYELDFTGTMTTLENPLGGDFNRINAVGYNIKDGFHWGSSFNQELEGFIFRVGKNGSNFESTQFGPIEGLTIDSQAGDIDSNGNLHLFRYKADEFSFIEVVDLDPNSPTYLQMTGRYDLKKSDGSPTFGLKLTDFAFHPTDGMIYAIQNGTSNYLWRINPNSGLAQNLGQLNMIGHGGLSGTEACSNAGGCALYNDLWNKYQIHAFGAMFFTKDGTFYFVESASHSWNLAGHDNQSRLWAIDLTNPSTPNLNASVVANLSQTVQYSDGVMCPGTPIMQDLPDTPNSYNNNAPHTLSASPTIYLGNIAPDSEFSSILDADNAEDDGVSYNGSPLQGAIIDTDSTTSSTISFDITNTGNGYLNAWIDWDGNGDFENNPNEKVIDTLHLTSSGTTTVNITIPAIPSPPAKTYARFRFSTDMNLSSTGLASDGEVEDYMIDLNVSTANNTFDAWDSNESIANKIISTKIVAKPFEVTIGSVDGATKSTLVKNGHSNAKVYINSINPPFTTPAIPLPLNMIELNATNQTDINLSSPLASKQAYVVIEYTDSNGSTKTAQSTDAFAIIPAKYNIILNPSSPITAGEEFNITIQALADDGSVVSNYDNTPSSYNINTSTIPSTCQGTFTNPGNQAFNSGVATISGVKYIGINDLNITVSENSSSLYASIDSPSPIQITPASITPTFEGANFRINWDHTNYDTANNATFYAQDPTTIGSKLDLTITAIDLNGNPITNFRSGCFSEDTDVTVNFTTSSTSDNLNTHSTLVGDKNTPLPASSFTQTITANNFTNGVANDTIDLNFDRSLSIPLNPADLNITNIMATSALISSSSSIPTNTLAKFYYIRAHAPDYYTTSSPFDATVYYEVYCKNCDTIKYPLAQGEESKDSVYWYILDSSIYNTFGATLNPIVSSNNPTVTISSFSNPDKIGITTTKIPSKTKVTFTTLPWLGFMSTNPSFYVNFNAKGQQWVGKGDVGKGVDLDISVQKVNKMQW